VTLRAVEGASREGWCTPLLYGCRILLKPMQKCFTTVAVSLLGAVATSVATMPTPSFASSSILLKVISEAPTTQETATRLVVPEKSKETRFICKGCNDSESRTLAFMQDNGITDKNALATIMGNIKQESTFVANICEGGARTSYRGCRSGGYGIIQWTSINRYEGLGQHAARIGGNPSSIETQLDYMLHESDWKMIEDKMRTPGKSINDYMRLAKKWIRWGHHGARTYFAYNYSKKLVLEKV
jgi:hypothetical protein